MAAEAIYLEDSYLREWDAEVVKANGKFIVLDRTAFYPSSGGQPHDTGKMVRGSDGREFGVVFTGKFGGDVSHEVNGEGLKQGDRVRCSIDWDRRYRHMRMHTAAHIISEVFHRDSGALITGNQLGLDKSRIDFSLEDFDRDRMTEYFREANGIIGKDLDINIRSMPRDDAMKIPSITKLANILPPDVKELRIVEIGDFDTQADGGTHVKKTSEIGKVEFLKAENKGKNNRRVYFTVD